MKYLKILFTQERSRVDYQDRIKELERKLAQNDVHSKVYVVAKMESEHKIQMEHLGEQYKLSMGELDD